MQVNEFAYQIEAMCDRLVSVHQNVNQLPLPLQNWLEEVLGEVGTILEELHVVQKELLQQNEELVAARRAVEAQRQRYQELFDFAPDAYLVTDANGTIQEANCAAAILLNISQEFLVGKPLDSFVPQEERNAFRCRLNQLSKKMRLVREWEVRLCPTGGEPFDAAFRVTAFQYREQESISLRCVVRDITLAKQAEQKLRDNEERFRSLSACSPVGIFLTDVGGRCTYTNPRCQGICGFTLEESLGEGWSHSVHPEDRERVFADWSNITGEGRGYSDEFRLQTKEGRVRWVHVRSSPMFSDCGELIGHVGTIEDITERKIAEQRLRESENRWRAMIETEPECVKLVASDGTLLNMNAAGLAMIEAPSTDTVIGQSVYSLIAPEHREAFVAFNESVCQGNRGTLEFEIIGLQGTRRWMETHAVPLRSESDARLVHLAITRDITERKIAEEELRQMNTALENAVEGISRLDTQGHYIAVNKAYARTLGYQPEEMIGMAWQQTVHPDDLQKLVDAYQQMLKDGKAEVEARGLGKDGSIFYKQVVMVAAYDSRRQFIGHHCFTKDITERKIAEAALKQAKQELEIRVEERTAQLRAANEQLLSEVIERKRAEVELEKSLSLLRGTLEATADGIIVSQDGKYIATCNHKFIEMWGIPESVIASGELKQLLPLILEQIQDYEGFMSQTQDLLSQENAEAYGIYELKDGRIFERYSLPQRIGGNIVGRVCCFRDITDRQRTQKALQEKEAFLQLVLDNIPQFIFWKDRNSVYFGCNRNFALVAGVSTPEEIVGLTDYDLAWKTEEADFFRECDARVMETDTPEYHIIEPQLQANGKQAWLDTNKVPLHDAEGNVVGILGTFEDITERRIAELEIQQSEQKYRNLFHNSLVGIFRNTLADGTVLDANAAILKMFGFDSYEQVQAVDLYVNSADRETLKQLLLEKGFVENFETQVRRKDGSVFWVSYSGKLYAKEGYLEGIMIDITERKIAEKALKKAKEELEIRVKERTTELRQAVRQLQAEIEERKRTEEELQRSEARFRELACREALLNRLASQIRKSLSLDTILETAVQEISNRLAIDVCVFAWYDSDATPPSWEVVQEAKNSDLPSFLGLYPLESWRPFTCKLVNQDVLQVDNVTQSDAFGTAPSTPRAVQQMLLPFGTAALLSLPIHTQSGKLGAIACGRLASGQSWTDEELELLQAVANQLVIGINQAQLYEQSRIAAIAAQTKAAELEIALRELQQTQAQLIQSEKMSSLGQLVAGVAHEINNPLNFIHGNLTHVNQYAKDLLNLIQLYQDYYTRPAPDIQAETEAIDLDFLKEDLPKILSSMTMGADRIRQIVLSLRNFSRLDQTERKWTDIHEGLDNTLLILAHRLKDKPHRPSIEVIKEYGDLPLVKCYSGQLNQVFMNILSNGIEAIEEDSKDRSPEESENHPGIIRIRTEVNHTNQVVIRIADNGPGMTQEVQQKIFDPFFTTKPVGSGTGLGMSISYQIVVEKHGGQLKCISAPGQGTEFLIYIPVQQQKSSGLLKEGLGESLTNDETIDATECCVPRLPC